MKKGEVRVRVIIENGYPLRLRGSDFLSHKYSIRDSEADKGNSYEGDNVGNYYIDALGES